MNRDEEKLFTVAGHNSAVEGMSLAYDKRGARAACAVGYGMLQGVLRIWRAALRDVSDDVFAEFVQTHLQKALDYVKRMHPVDVAVEEKGAATSKPTLN